VTYSDSGKKQFNYSEWVGNATGVAISNAYYPDGRNVEDNVTKLLSQCATDAVSQVLKEFWPDIKQGFSATRQPPITNLLPVPSKPPDQNDLAQMICIVIGKQQRFSQQRLSSSMREWCEQVERFSD